MILGLILAAALAVLAVGTSTTPKVSVETFAYLDKSTEGISLMPPTGVVDGS